MLCGVVICGVVISGVGMCGVECFHGCVTVCCAGLMSLCRVCLLVCVVCVCVCVCGIPATSGSSLKSGVVCRWMFHLTFCLSMSVQHNLPPPGS